MNKKICKSVYAKNQFLNKSNKFMQSKRFINSLFDQWFLKDELEYSKIC